MTAEPPQPAQGEPADTAGYSSPGYSSLGQSSPAFGAPFAAPHVGYGPPQGNPAPENPWSTYATPPFGSDAQPGARKRGLNRRSVIALGVIGVIVIGLIAAAVAVRAQREPAHRSVTMPDTVVGLAQVHTPELDQAALQAQTSLVSETNAFTDAHVAYFGEDGGTGGVDLAVIAAKIAQRPSAADRQHFFSGMANALGAHTTLTPMSSGPYGGTLECGPTMFGTTPATICASLDSAAYVMVIAYNADETSAADTTRGVISTVEH